MDKFVFAKNVVERCLKVCNDKYLQAEGRWFFIAYF